MLLTYFCKKGGVGKTTITGEHANYLASLGKKVLIISIDDQNSIFEMFGASEQIFATENNYIEHLVTKNCTLEESLHHIRENLYAVKTLNTDMLSKKLTLERSFEKSFVETIKSFNTLKFDYIFFDLPPSSNRTSEVLLEMCDDVLLIVELNKLGVNGFYNTLQYFTDSDIPLDKIKYILPNGFSKNKAAPTVALEEIVALTKENIPGVKILDCMPEKSTILSLQQKGISVFDKNVKTLSSYTRSQKKAIMQILSSLFDSIKLKK